MLKSVLLYLENAEQAASVIEFGVSLASQTEARVRGLTLVDTRRYEQAADCESAAFLSCVAKSGQEINFLSIELSPVTRHSVS